MELYKGRVFSVIGRETKNRSGSIKQREIVVHPGAVVILPQIDSKYFLMIKQWREAVGRELLEFPAGTLDRTEQPLDCAKRELVEEAGRVAEHWTELGNLYPAPGFCTEFQYLYFASGLREVEAQPEDDEMITLAPMSIGEIEAKIISGDICDAKSIGIFYRARLKGLVE